MGATLLLIVTQIFLGSLSILCSTYLINSVVIISLLIVGKLKFLPSCKSACTSDGMCVENKLTNHCSWICNGEVDGSWKKEGLRMILWMCVWGEEVIGFREKLVDAINL